MKNTAPSQTSWHLARALVLSIFLVALGSNPGTLSAQDQTTEKAPAFQVPEGFVIEPVAGQPLVEHPMFACFDDRGRLLVADSLGIYRCRLDGSEVEMLSASMGNPVETAFSAEGEANLPWYLAKNFPSDECTQVRGWTEVLRFIRATDPFRRPLTIHPTAINRDTSRHATDDETLLDFRPHANAASPCDQAIRCRSRSRH